MCYKAQHVIWQCHSLLSTYIRSVREWKRNVASLKLLRKYGLIEKQGQGLMPNPVQTGVGHQSWIPTAIAPESKMVHVTHNHQCTPNTGNYSLYNTIMLIVKWNKCYVVITKIVQILHDTYNWNNSVKDLFFMPAAQDFCLKAHHSIDMYSILSKACASNSYMSLNPTSTLVKQQGETLGTL